ncbi:hypothetical protein ACGFIF_42890 [Kribbella sp. NPDC049174]|uniref:hypothetical protein n=1 Tax=Kribbella sp. NPDC049174 TaxID=3364112 RepID=UPI00371AB9E2
MTSSTGERTLELVPDPNSKNYDAMTTDELYRAAYAWIEKQRHELGDYPTQDSVGAEFGKSRSWGRDRVNDVKLMDKTRDGGTEHATAEPIDKGLPGETADPVAEEVSSAASHLEVDVELNAWPVAKWSKPIGPQSLVEIISGPPQHLVEPAVPVPLGYVAPAQQPAPVVPLPVAEASRVEEPVAQVPADAEETPPGPTAAEVLAASVTDDHHRHLKWLMYGFYGVAAAAALTGQVWAGVEKIPFPDSLPIWARAAAVAPAFAVIEFGGVVTAAAADLRRRLGERATGFRIMSFGAAAVAAGFNLVGHWGDWFPAIGFTGLSVFAYVLWLLYSESGRRDVLRNAGLMARPAPVYSTVQWLREFRLTVQARRLAIEFGYGTHESLRKAREANLATAAEHRVELERQQEQKRQDRRRAAIAKAIERRVRALSKDDIGAEIAVTTINLDRVVDEAERRVDYDGWGELIESDLRPFASDATGQRQAPSA